MNAGAARFGRRGMVEVRFDSERGSTVGWCEPVRGAGRRGPGAARARTPRAFAAWGACSSLSGVTTPLALWWHEPSRHLVLTLGGRDAFVDPYYLGEPASVARLLEQWLALVDALPDGGTCFLPYDLSDESSAWLRCRRERGEVVVEPGVATVPGYSVSPADIGPAARTVADWAPLDARPPLRLERGALLEAIRHGVNAWRCGRWAGGPPG